MSPVRRRPPSSRICSTPWGDREGRRQPECSFRLVDEGRYPEEDLRALAENFAALLFRLENAREDEFGEKIQALNEELSSSGTQDLEEAFDIWLNRVIKLRFPSLDIEQLRGRENRTMLSESIGEWIQKAERRGLRKGRRKGREEGRHRCMQELILGQLKERFGNLPAAIESRIRQLTSPARLQEVARQIVRIDSLDELKIT